MAGRRRAPGRAPRPRGNANGTLVFLAIAILAIVGACYGVSLVRY